MPAVQITTGTACHLDAHMVHEALHDLDLDGLDILFIENVGNLVCPAAFDLGQHRNVTLLSVTEGDDKPAKYPVMFRSLDLVLITKSDLAPVIGRFRCGRAEAALHRIACPAPMLTLSARRRPDWTRWLDWMRDRGALRRASRHDRGSGMAGADPRARPAGAVPHHERLRRP